MPELSTISGWRPSLRLANREAGDSGKCANPRRCDASSTRCNAHVEKGTFRFYQPPFALPSMRAVLIQRASSIHFPAKNLIVGLGQGGFFLPAAKYSFSGKQSMQGGFSMKTHSFAVIFAVLPLLTLPVSSGSTVPLAGTWKGTMSSKMKDEYAEIVWTIFQSGPNVSGRFVCTGGTLKCHTVGGAVAGT
jgi:hypothetical protein